MANTIEFTFSHTALTEDDKVQVLSYKGTEGISSLYEFDIELLSVNPDIDIDAVLDAQATLTIQLDTEERKLQGIISHCDAVSQINNQTLYKVKLVPKLWELSLFHTNEIYLEMNTKEIIEQVLQEAGFTTQDYDLSGLQGDYKTWPFRCQYSETHLNFISRLMERDGIYYYFTEGESGEKLIFCDSLQAQESITNSDVAYNPEASLEINALADTITSFVNQRQRLPYKVLLKDYNDDKPSVDIKGESIIDEAANPTSEIYVWGQNIQTPEEGEQLALIRAEEIKSRKSVFYGESSAIRLLSGHQFNLTGHFRTSCNQEYLCLTIEHEAKNPSLLDLSSSAKSNIVVYQNSFSAIPATVQFRPEQQAIRPEIHGTLNAIIDAEGDGHYAELDEEGRYRVTLPFDRVDRDGGKASHWVRMSQPFNGEGQGMHFPLHKGAEVLLTFIGGDPDRPVIAGAIDNASQPSIVNSENQSQGMIKTASGNKIEIEDKDDTNRIKLQTGDDKTYMHLGSPNHPGDGWVVVTDGIERKAIAGGQRLTISVDKDGNNQTESTTTNASGASVDAKARTAATQSKHTFQEKDEAGLNEGALDENDELSGKYLIERRSGDKYLWTDGHEYVYGGGNVFNFGNGYEESHINVDLINEQSETFRFTAIGNAINKDFKNPNSPIKKAWKEVEKAHQTLSKAKKHLAGWNDANSKSATTYGFQSSYNSSRYRYVENVVKVDNWLGEEESDGGQPKTYDDRRGRAHTAYLYSKAEIGQKVSKWQSKKDSAEDAIPGVEKKYQDLLSEASPIDFEDHTRHAVSDEHLVEKVWADTFAYQSGRNFAWGDTCDYNFGNGYEENIVEEPYEINADYSGSNDKAGSGGPGFGSISGSLVSLDEGSTCVGKTIGDSYDFVKGNSLEVVNGNSESHTYGDAHDEVHGHSIEHIRGSSHSTHHGATNEMFMGATSAFFLGADSEIKLSASNSMHVGLLNDMFVGGKLEMSVGPSTELFAGPDLEAKVTSLEAKVSNLETTASDIKTKANEISTQVNALTTGVSGLRSVATNLKNAGVDLSTGGIKMMS